MKMRVGRIPMLFFFFFPLKIEDRMERDQCGPKYLRTFCLSFIVISIVM